MTAGDAAKICCYKNSLPIRRAVARGDLPGTLLQKNRLLIPTQEFWKWFHRNDVKPKKAKSVEMPTLVPIPKTEAA